MNILELKNRVETLVGKAVAKGVDPASLPVFLSIDEGMRVERVEDVVIEFDDNPEPGLYLSVDADLA